MLQKFTVRTSQRANNRVLLLWTKNKWLSFTKESTGYVPNVYREKLQQVRYKIFYDRQNDKWLWFPREYLKCYISLPSELHNRQRTEVFYCGQNDKWLRFPKEEPDMLKSLTANLRMGKE